MFFEEELLMLLPALTTAIPSGLMSLAAYILSAYALCAIAQRRGLQRPWLAWIPVVNGWIMGSLSDQYQYLVKGQNKSKRKVLLVLNVLRLVFGGTMVVLAMVMAAGAVLAENDSRMMANIMGPMTALLGLCVPLAGISIAAAVIRYMAMYDIYRSSDPDNSVLYLVLSILVGITEPFFLFFNRNMDAGMPPRKIPDNVYTPPEAVEPDPWEMDQKDYL